MSSTILHTSTTRTLSSPCGSNIPRSTCMTQTLRYSTIQCKTVRRIQPTTLIAYSSPSPCQRRHTSTTSSPSQPEHHSRQQQQQRTQRQRSAIGAALFLSCAAYTAYLGTWQLSRKQQKLDAIAERQHKLFGPPLCYDTVVQQADGGATYEYNSVVTDGYFDYQRQYYIGPRPPPASTQDPLTGKPSTIIQPNTIGYYVITPVITADSGHTVLVNRGWVPKQFVESGNVPTEQRYATNDVVHIDGVLRASEAKPKYLGGAYKPNNNNELIFIDLPYMAAQYAGSQRNTPSTSTLYIEMNNPHISQYRRDIYPVRKQKNDLLHFATTPFIHTVYAGTWFTLSTALTALTYIRFIR